MADLFDKLASRQVTKTVKYKGLDDKQHERKITMDKPGWKTSMQFANLVNKGDGIMDLSAIYQLIMQKVVTEKMTFKAEDATLKKEHADELDKTVVFKDDDGKDVDIHIVFPGFRNAVRIAGLIMKNNNDLNAVDAFEYCVKYVFRDDKGNRFKSEFFDQFSLEQNMSLVSDTVQQVLKLADFDGFQSVMQAAITFLRDPSK